HVAGEDAVNYGHEQRPSPLKRKDKAETSQNPDADCERPENRYATARRLDTARTRAHREITAVRDRTRRVVGLHFWRVLPTCVNRRRRSRPARHTTVRPLSNPRTINAGWQ